MQHLSKRRKSLINSQNINILENVTDDVVVHISCIFLFVIERGKLIIKYL